MRYTLRYVMLPSLNYAMHGLILLELVAATTKSEGNSTPMSKIEKTTKTEESTEESDKWKWIVIPLQAVAVFSVLAIAAHLTWMHLKPKMHKEKDEEKKEEPSVSQDQETKAITEAHSIETQESILNQQASHHVNEEPSKISQG